ncbi:MAG: glycosyltransferase family 2 protein [Gemmataceae bacterium]|nr:glycosyltransferase family 2 protein [Gemmataceae bacterium]
MSAVIINYREWQSTAKLTRQILRTTAAKHGIAEVVVVDNHSPSHRVVSRMRRWPGVSLRRWRRNHGFARAANEGCRLSRGKWLLLLNPDVTLAPDFLDQLLPLIDELERDDPRCGVVGFGIRNSDGTAQLSSGPFPTLAGTLLGLTRPRHRRKYREITIAERCEVPWVTGCCLLVRGECLRELGGFDERFFLYYEDVDFCRRAAEKGWSVCYEPRLQAIHHCPLHRRQVPSHLRVITRHALLTYGARHWPRWQFRLLASIVQAEARLRQAWAQWNRDTRAQSHFKHLEALTRDLAHDDPTAARRRLRRVVESVETNEPQ